jgi:hypothetical protein
MVFFFDLVFFLRLRALSTLTKGGVRRGSPGKRGVIFQKRFSVMPIGYQHDFQRRLGEESPKHPKRGDDLTKRPKAKLLDIPWQEA